VDGTVGGGDHAAPAASSPSSSSSRGWGPAARGVAATLVDIGQTRLQLLATEVEEEGLRVAHQAYAAAGALFAFALGIVLACIALVLLVAPADRPLVLAGLAVACFAFGAWGVLRWQRIVAMRPPLLQATLAELQKDRAALLGARLDP